MQADADFKGGWYDPQKPPTLGPRAFARVYAGWGFSQPFYWEQVTWQHSLEYPVACGINMEFLLALNLLVLFYAFLSLHVCLSCFLLLLSQV